MRSSTDDCSRKGNGPSAEEELEGLRNKQAFAALLEAMPKEFAEVRRLREIEELSGEETAQRLDISLAAMKSRLHRARWMVRVGVNAVLAAERVQ